MEKEHNGKEARTREILKKNKKYFFKHPLYKY
jgi:hypothetical protein